MKRGRQNYTPNLIRIRNYTYYMKNPFQLNRAFILIALLFIVNTVYSQSTARPKATQTQWEYLVVAFGKVYFSDPLTASEAKSTGLSKLLSFSRAGIVLAQEGMLTQKSMDTLG